MSATAIPARARRATRNVGRSVVFMDSRSAGVVVIAIGAIIVVGGLLLSAGGLSWLGRLPGDIRIEGERVKVYIPIASMLLVSVLLSAVIWVVRRVMRS
jgi:hypothetical protein